MEWLQQAAAAAATTESHAKRVVPPVVPGRVLHMDGDILAYWAGGSETRETSRADSRQLALQKIVSMQEQAGAESVVLHLTHAASTKGDRFIIATLKPYQGQRKSGRKPPNWGYLREFLENYAGPVFRPKVWTAREADDGVACCAWADKEPWAQRTAICSKDKDFRMIPGLHIDWDTYEQVAVTPGAYSVIGPGGKEYGSKWFWLQMLQGDKADNIPGLPYYIDESGAQKLVGDATAAALLAPCANEDEARATVIGLYRGWWQERWAEQLVEQAALLWLRPDLDAGFNSLRNVLVHPAALAAIDNLQQRIGESYATAQALGATRLPGDSPG